MIAWPTAIQVTKAIHFPVQTADERAGPGQEAGRDRAARIA